jgi:hypothetical protein
LSNDDGINAMQNIEPEIHSIVNETGERLKEGNEKGYLSFFLSVFMWMVTINGRFYTWREDLNQSYLKLNIIYRYRNNGGSQNRCRVKEKNMLYVISI